MFFNYFKCIKSFFNSIKISIRFLKYHKSKTCLRGLQRAVQHVTCSVLEPSALIMIALLLRLDPNTKWHSSLKTSSSSQHIRLSPNTPKGKSGCRAWHAAWPCGGVLQTPVMSNIVVDIIPISWCPSGGEETSAIYLHNGCILLCGNVLSWATPTGQITASHSGNPSHYRHHCTDVSKSSFNA